MASTLGQYYIRLKGQSGVEVARFDDWVSLAYTNARNDVGTYQLVVDGDDDRIELFQLDGQLEVWRSLPELGLGWYLDFEGFHRKEERVTASDGKRTFISTGVGYNDLLARTAILFKEGTIRAEKNAPAETVMKEYVTENCTSKGDDRTVVGRLNYDEHRNNDAGQVMYATALPGFGVDRDNYGGPTWQGERAYENLLTTLQDIANTTGVDFQVVGTGNARFTFYTFLNGLGLDRRFVLIDTASGLNQSGNTPILFSTGYGSVQELSYVNDRLKEANAVVILGPGELSLRETYTSASPTAIADSPWNRREITRPGSNQTYAYQFWQLGSEALAENTAIVSGEFTPLQTESHALGLHYDIGDMVTLQYDSLLINRRIDKVIKKVDGSGESISIEFYNKNGSGSV